MTIDVNPYPKVSEACSQSGARFPVFLSKNFARILRRIEMLWGQEEDIDYLDSLIFEDIPDKSKSISNREDHSNHTTRTRQGFPIEAMEEIVLLKQVHQLLYISLNTNPYDHISGSELVPIKINTKTLKSQFSSQNIDAIDSDSGVVIGNRQIKWPILLTQSELTEKFKLLGRGENIYPLQGKPVGEILLHYGVIVEDTLRVVLDMQKRTAHKSQSIGEILVEVGILRQDELRRSLLIQAGIPMVDVLSIEIPPEITKIIPYDNAREKMAVPIGIYKDCLYLAVADPFTFEDQPYFTMMTGMKIDVVFAPMHEIVNFLNKRGSGKKRTGLAKEEFRNLATSDLDFPLGNPIVEDVAIADVTENDSIIVNLVNQMILNAIQESASDIHIELFNNGEESSVRFRRDGNMEDFADFPRAYHKAVVSRIKIMASMDISETRRPQDGKISFSIPNDGKIDLRVVTIPATPGVEFVTIRLLASGEPLPLGELGMAKRDVTVFREVFQQPYGLILVCGPTGSGKTTTLHSVLRELNTKERKIWTAEDPVEIVQPHLCQVQVNSKIGMTFATLLRSFLRADPDVIMIGEMRDQETAKIALEASMTGHLVLSTLHANSASETVSRLLGLNIDPYNLSDALLAILAQRLARKLCNACAHREEASDSDIADLTNEYFKSAHTELPTTVEFNNIIQGWIENYGVKGKLYLTYPVGCEMCDGGYKGRIGLYELLHATPALRHLIRQQSAASEYLTSGVSDGMRTLKQDGIEKVIQGITDMIQVRGACM